MPSLSSRLSEDAPTAESTTTYHFPERPWQHIGIDLFVDMPTDERGYKHVLVAVCYLSKYVVARPLKLRQQQKLLQCYWAYI